MQTAPFLLGLLFWALISWPTTGLAAEDYASLPGYKAAAVYSTNKHLPYVAQGQPNKLAAAVAAQRACQQANPTQNSTAYCELVQLDDQLLTTSVTIKARLPNQPHPLYLWRYSRGDATVYLAGSVHILKLGLYPLPPQYQQAFDASDNLVVEVNLSAFTAEQLQFKSMQYALLANEQQLPDVLSAQSYAQLNTVSAEYGLPLAQMARFKPAFITQQLAVLALMATGYDPSRGVEKYFTDQIASSDHHKNILQLETLDFQLDLLMNQPLTTQRIMVDDTLAQMDDFEPFTADLVTAWLSGNDAAFEEAFNAQSGDSAESQAFMRQLMDVRNEGMAEKIAGFLNGTGTYFVLVGAAHYIGNNSVIELLRRRGIQGLRISSDQNLTP